MGITRRRFLETSVGAGVAASHLLKADGVVALPADAGIARQSDEQVVPAPTGEWMTNTPASAYRAYRSKPAKTADAPTWVQINLGESRQIDFVKVYPANEKGFPGRDEDYAGEGFPVRFKIESSTDPDFHNAALIVDHTDADYPNPKGNIEKYAAQGVSGRYVRLTATRLMNVVESFSGANGANCYLALGKVEVYSGGKEIAALCPVTVDSTHGNDNDVAQVTRPARARAAKPPSWTILRTSPGRRLGSLRSTRPACPVPG